METKCCKRCGVEQPVTEFPRYNSGQATGYRGFCRPCLSAKSLEYSHRNPEHTYLVIRNRMLRHRYGIEEADYQRMFQEQHGKCAICRTDKPTRTGKKLLTGDDHAFHVDHDHETGAVRGLLCPSCNKALGLLGEHNLSAAIEYINHHKKENDSHS